MLDIVTATTLYPNALQPRHGIFVERRLLELTRTGAIHARVVAPVPWFPWRSKRFGRYGVYAEIPASEVRHGIPVAHPRYPVLPKIGMHVAPALMAARRACRSSAALDSGGEPPGSHGGPRKRESPRRHRSVRTACSAR